MNNVSSIKHLCAGCGACAGVCSRIDMGEDEFGLLMPRIAPTCTSCGKCLQVCPTLMAKEKKKEIRKNIFEEQGCQYKEETGYYLNCYEGYIPEYREKSASGGLCSELLISLLDNKIVDSVYCVGSTGKNTNLFSYIRVQKSEDVLKYARSAYYPISIDSAIMDIRRNNEKAAIVCLPCQATAIRALQKTDHKLKDRIAFVIGLVCGGVPGKGMIQYVLEAQGIDPDKVTRVTFREKDEGIMCNNCQMKAYNRNSEVLSVSRYHGEAFGFAYFSKLFHYDACFCCDDIFAESADVAFGDAWFEEYKQNIYGTSICITRNQLIDDILKTKTEKSTVNSTCIDRMILSQKSVYLVQRKKNLSHIYRKCYKRVGLVFPDDEERGFAGKQEIKIRLKYFFRNKAKKSWRKYVEGKTSFEDFNKKYQKTIRDEKRLHL